jgi:hypothetical protein
VVTPGDHPSPQILILPDDWLWPTERTRIDIAYELFVQWCENHYVDNTWVNKYNSGSVVHWY